ncbi:uncharacterized protein LOC141713809 [Apium graveolens]|uniref:uncharacterized protein LOC141713809 n=1 Tax=Apium graveolens TaxID=4045 RepID=UPI003D7AC768
MRMLAYDISADAVDDYVRIGESTAVEALKKFVFNIITLFEGEYLRKPNSNDVQRLLQMSEARGFPGMMGSIDCMHWQWKNCPKAWKRMFMSGHKGVAIIILEAVASSDLWICHAFFGVAGSNNDINILDRSPIFDEVLQGRAPESCFAIVRGPTRFWDKDDLGRIMRACIIIHNMIVEDERDTYATQFGPMPGYDDATNGLSQPNLDEEPFAAYETYIQNTIQMRDKRTHRQLQNDLVEHISQFHINR